MSKKVLPQVQKYIDDLTKTEGNLISLMDSVHDISDCYDEEGKPMEEHQCECDGDGYRMIDNINFNEEQVVERCKSCCKIKKIEWLEGAWDN